MNRKRFMDVSNPDLKGIYVIVDEETGERLSSVELLIDRLNDLSDRIMFLEERERRLFDYFSKWFDEERCVYYDDFLVWWCGICDGSVVF